MVVCFYLSLYCSCVFLFYMFLIYLLILTIHQQVLFFFHIHANIDKDFNCVQSNNNASLKDLRLLFSASFLFLKIWFSKIGNITLRLFLFLIFYLLLFLHKHIKTSDHQETVRSCRRYEFFTSDFIDTDIQSLITQLTINHYSIPKLKYQNLNSFSHLLLLLSGDISLNPGPVHQDTLQCSNE